VAGSAVAGDLRRIGGDLVPGINLGQGPAAARQQHVVRGRAAMRHPSGRELAASAAFLAAGWGFRGEALAGAQHFRVAWARSAKFRIIFPDKPAPARDAGSHGWMIWASIGQYQCLRPFDLASHGPHMGAAGFVLWISPLGLGRRDPAHIGIG
jgi:hypothetical protein